MADESPEAVAPASPAPESKPPNVFDEMAAAGELRRKSITWRKAKILVREPSGLEQVDYLTTSKSDKGAAITALFLACVINEDGSPAMTPAQARAIATGNVHVMVPVLNGILSFQVPEKKS